MATWIVAGVVFLLAGVALLRWRGSRSRWY
jgi:hypothetical protein